MWEKRTAVGPGDHHTPLLVGVSWAETNIAAYFFPAAEPTLLPVVGAGRLWAMVIDLSRSLVYLSVKMVRVT